MSEEHFREPGKLPGKMTPYQFYQALHKMHYAHKIADELETLDQIDAVVDMMDEYPEAEYIIQKILRRLYNDRHF